MPRAAWALLAAAPSEVATTSAAATPCLNFMLTPGGFGAVPPSSRQGGVGLKLARVPRPMEFADLAFAGAARQADLLRAGQLSSRELVEGYLARIEKLDPTLNAFRLVSSERALAEAEQADARLRAGDERPLLGVPVAVKDNVDVAGDVPLSCTRPPPPPPPPGPPGGGGGGG